ncbi:hypothetical protein CHELA20_52582 [Hyphomicrobiales bacterium]|nr:hypothetical protein CHELA20_52582 [Hyphomicrobiales bacterium]
MLSQDNISQRIFLTNIHSDVMRISGARDRPVMGLLQYIPRSMHQRSLEAAGSTAVHYVGVRSNRCITRHP